MCTVLEVQVVSCSPYKGANCNNVSGSIWLSSAPLYLRVPRLCIERVRDTNGGQRASPGLGRADSARAQCLVHKIWGSVINSKKCYANKPCASLLMNWGVLIIRFKLRLCISGKGFRRQRTTTCLSRAPDLESESSGCPRARHTSACRRKSRSRCPAAARSRWSDWRRSTRAPRPAASRTRTGTAAEHDHESVPETGRRQSCQLRHCAHAHACATADATGAYSPNAAALNQSVWAKP